MGFPVPLVATEAVLVETFEEGRLVSDFTGPAGPRLPPDVAHFVITRGEDLYLKMLLADGLMHADLHPVRPAVGFASCPSRSSRQGGASAACASSQSQAS